MGATLSALPPIVLRASVADDAGFAYDVTEKTMRGYVVATWGEWRSDAVREALRAQAAGGKAQGRKGRVAGDRTPHIPFPAGAAFRLARVSEPGYWHADRQRPH